MTPRFYSKSAIAWLTIILSPFLGGILFSYNLRAVGKGKYGIYFIVVGMFSFVIFRKLTDGFIHNYLIELLISNLVGAILLTFFFWDKFLGNYPDYEARPIWKPALVFVGLCVFFILLQYWGARLLTH